MVTGGGKDPRSFGRVNKRRVLLLLTLPNDLGSLQLDSETDHSGPHSGVPCYLDLESPPCLRVVLSDLGGVLLTVNSASPALFSMHEVTTSKSAC
ncbi:hypothetical protein R1flu_013063 [Riccia fluitans]|uniref:Uncharacterized protein n=1 Tax=Riccia fluitans TaxID=41844 RepID=A0ABD1ZCI8_9MARC